MVDPKGELKSWLDAMNTEDNLDRLQMEAMHHVSMARDKLILRDHKMLEKQEHDQARDKLVSAGVLVAPEGETDA